MPELLEVKVAEIEQRCKSNTKRIDKLEEEQDALRSIATSVAVMAERTENISQKVDKIDLKVDMLESVPAGRWNGLVEKLLFAVAGGLAAWILGMILR